jgi:hypothetical protein
LGYPLFKFDDKYFINKMFCLKIYNHYKESVMKVPFVLLLVFLVTGCKHVYYLPNTQQVPMFRQKGESRIAFQLGGASECSSREINAAYAVTNHLAVMANYMAVRGGESSQNSDWGKGNYYEAAIGYYKPLRNIYTFESYVGGSYSSQTHQYTSFGFYGANGYGGSSSLSFSKLFIQPSIGVNLKGVALALSTRISKIHFYNINNQILSTTGTEFQRLNSISNHPNSILLEPAFTVRGGWKYINLQLQLQLSSNLTNKDLLFENSNTSIGICFNFSNTYVKRLFRKK